MAKAKELPTRAYLLERFDINFNTGKNMITVEKKKVARSGVPAKACHLGHVYVQEVLSVKSDKWCVLEDGKILAECRSKAAAQKISEAFEWIGHGA